MLGIIFLVFIGQKFYDLAALHQRHKWAYAILGVVSYYVGMFIGGVAIAFYVGFTDPYGVDAVDDMSDIMTTLIALPFGLLTCYLCYTLLKRNWEKPTFTANDEILDIEDDLL